VTYCKNVPVGYSGPMHTKTQGYEITGVAGVAKITIQPKDDGEGGDYVETVLEFESINTAISFDLNGLRGFLLGIREAERLGSLLEAQIENREQDA
jgi:hypothetical protein